MAEENRTLVATPQVQDVPGRFDAYGGRYVPETLMAALQELEAAYADAQRDPAFASELSYLLHHYAGRPTPLYHASRLTDSLGGAKIYLKREDLLHTGAHKINNCLGQGLLARRMGKRRIIAETGAGQHGVATATVCALFGMECIVYMGQEDMRRQELNVYRMRLLGAEVRSVNAGSATLKDAINEAMRDWVVNVRTTHYLLGSVLGAHPYPTMVRDFQRVISVEARRQILEAEGRLPNAVLACVGGGSNAIGAFYEFIPDKNVRLIGVEAGGRGPKLGEHRLNFRAAYPACYREHTPTCCRMKRAKFQTRIPSPRVSIMLRSARNTRPCTIPDVPNMCPPQTKRRCKPRSKLARMEGIYRRSKVPMRSQRRYESCLP